MCINASDCLGCDKECEDRKMGQIGVRGERGPGPCPSGIAGPPVTEKDVEDFLSGKTGEPTEQEMQEFVEQGMKTLDRIADAFRIKGWACGKHHTQGEGSEGFCPLCVPIEKLPTYLVADTDGHGNIYGMKPRYRSIEMLWDKVNELIDRVNKL